MDSQDDGWKGNEAKDGSFFYYYFLIRPTARKIGIASHKSISELEMSPDDDDVLFCGLKVEVHVFSFVATF